MSSYGIGSSPKNTRKQKWTRVGKEETKPSCPWMNDASGRGRGQLGAGAHRVPPGGAELCTSGDEGRRRVLPVACTRAHLWQRRQAEAAVAGRALLPGFLKTDGQCLLPSPCTQIRLHTRAHVSVGSKPKEQCQRKQNHVNKTSFSLLFHSDSVLHAYFSLCCWKGRGPRH